MTYVPTMSRKALSDSLTFSTGFESRAQYDRTPPRNVADYPTCATQAQHDTAHNNCKPKTTAAVVLRGLGLLDLVGANPCWVETLPICPATRPPTMRTPPRIVPRTPAPAPAPVTRPPTMVTPPRIVAPPPPPPPVTRPPTMVTPPRIVAPPPPPPPPVVVAPPPPPVVIAPPPPPPPVVIAPPMIEPPMVYPEEPPVVAPPPAQAGFGTGGLLALAAAVAVGGWFLFGRKKKQAA